jgi:uncharacterized protein involved in response to NO
MAANPGTHDGSVFLTAGFRPFFLLGTLWAMLAMPLWLAFFAGVMPLPSGLAPWIWHAHEMIFGYAMAVIAGFLLTAIPNWTGRPPLRGAPLAILAALWLAGRIAVLISTALGAPLAAAVDLAFPLVFLLAVAREIIAGNSRRNLPMVAALGLLFAGNLLVHLEALGSATTAELGIRIGLATVLMLIALVGGRIIPNFTSNWLTTTRSGTALPAAADRLDMAALVVTAVAAIAWAAAPDAAVAPWLELAAGIVLFARLARWRGIATTAEPLLWILHVGYAWLAAGFLLLAADGFWPLLPASSALHALTTGAVGTMTLAVMTRATLGHTGQALTAGVGTTAIYGLVTVAAVLRLIAPLCGVHYLAAITAAGLAWSGAFLLFVALYGPALVRPRGAPAG